MFKPQLHFSREIRRTSFVTGTVVLLILAIIQTAIPQPQPAAAAVESPWTGMDRLPDDRPAATVWIRAQKHQVVNLDHVRLRQVLDAAPNETGYANGRSPAQVSLPMPDGAVARFRFVESPVMAPELAAKFPDIKTYLGQGIDDPAASVRFDLTPAGFHAQILSPRGTVYIDPAFRGDNQLHTSYYKRDYRGAADGFRCLVGENFAGRGTRENSGVNTITPLDLSRSGGSLRTYRLAVAATGEYTAYQGGTVAAGLSAIVTAVNRVTGVYEAEVAIRLVLVANNDLIIYTNSASDPYSNTSGSTMLDQNQTTLDSVIGSANYDIGHVFGTGVGGIAGLGVVCVGGNKARGVTGKTSPTGDSFWIDYVAHEMGHQFGANHTFNSSTSNCGGGNRNASTAYEPGSGSTIMAYAGICGADNLQPHSDPYFHAASFDEILSYSTTGSGNSCAVVTATGNNAPAVSAGANYTIPQNTPFTLAATGSDADGDPLTFCWEERDLGVSTTVSAADNGSSPIFRSWNPTTSPSRTFPDLPDLLSHTLSVGEVMPTTTRTMNFRVTARDNRAGGGGVNTSDMQVNVTTSAGPFVVTSHNSGGTFSGLQTVTWNVAGTTNAPIGAANVNLLLSTNGGQTFPIMLMANAPNDGSQAVVLPNVDTTTARIKVEAVGNIFFALCNADFTIIPGIPTPIASLESATLTTENCAVINHAIDPGETVTLSFALKNTGSGDTTKLVATLLVTNGVTFPSAPQNYGVLTAGGASVSRAFSLVATGACGGSITAVLQLQDGAANLGTVSQTFNLGALVATTTLQTNSASIAIPGSGTKGPASPFPSTISVSGVTGTVSKVTVTLAGFSHTWPADVDALLVGPSGQTLLFLSDAGGGSPVSGLTLTFDDDAAATLSDTATFSSGTFKPTNYGAGDTFSSPAPGGSYGSTLSVFNGLDPNGTWSLYVQDDGSQDTGSIAQGWQLNVTTAAPTCCVGNLLESDLIVREFATPGSLNVGSNLIFSVNVTNLGPDTASSVVLTDVLPAGVSFDSAMASQGNCTSRGGVVNCALGSLTNSGFVSLTIQATTTTAGLQTNTVSAASATLDPFPANNLDSATFTVNAFPTLTHIDNVMTDEDRAVGPLNFTIGDPETPATSLLVTVSSANPGLVPPVGLALSGSGSNRSLTIMPSANQSGTALITLFVTDGQATNSDFFTLTVNAVNDPPVLAAITNFTLVEGETLAFTNFASDVEAPPELLTFSLANAPINATINPTNGVFTWVTTEADGPGTNLISVVVTDNGLPSLSATQSFTVIVLETNRAPVLAPIPDHKIHAGMTLLVTNIAVDLDLPPNALTFSLDAGAPASASIGTVDGIFAWTPSDADANTVQSVTVRVTDNGVPPLDDAKTFLVAVVSRPIITDIGVTGNLVQVTWTSLAGKMYQLQLKTNLDDTNWSEVLPDVLATGSSATQTNAYVPEVSHFYRVAIVP